MATIHPTAIISPAASLADDVTVGPYTVIDGEVVIGQGTVVDHHVTIAGQTTIGSGCRIYPYALVGTDPQDLKYRGGDSALTIGDQTVIREYVTVSRGTPTGGGITRVGSNTFFMAYCHVAHDCQIGNQVIMANGATLAGHILIEDQAIIGGLAAIHQFCRIGCHAMIAGMAGVSQDVPPYCMASGNHSRLYGLNLIGLRRQGFSRETISALKKTFRILFRTSGLNLNKAMAQVESELPPLPEITHMLDFIRGTERGICRKS
ncbi:MAG: acyl-ACP--UDP-N-acetylglucosamine O-acyltransferase [Deltaproteobacteria bacterium]|nr:acyl-ACP--UDP-N-acetylglucosamine O-acyltransferase [Candidatus Anaeroferrophillus wilburensis]MBN2889752.1 acyl-ACP--UDP-N-acetylglucosamine O-acyltransferase [Deltaproteobacteria bacterium]